MDAAECNKRACECAASAAIAPGESLALEFLQLAARENFLGELGESAAPTADLKA